MNADELRLLYFTENDKSDHKLTFEQWLSRKELQKGKDWWIDRPRTEGELPPRPKRPPIPAVRGRGRGDPKDSPIVITSKKIVDGKEEIHKTIRLQSEIDKEAEIADLKKSLKEEVTREILGSVKKEERTLTSSDGMFVIHSEALVLPEKPESRSSPKKRNAKQKAVTSVARKRKKPLARERSQLTRFIHDVVINDIDYLDERRPKAAWDMLINDKFKVGPGWGFVVYSDNLIEIAGEKEKVSESDFVTRYKSRFK